MRSPTACPTLADLETVEPGGEGDLAYSADEGRPTETEGRAHLAQEILELGEGTPGIDPYGPVRKVFHGSDQPVAQGCFEHPGPVVDPLDTPGRNALPVDDRLHGIPTVRGTMSLASPLPPFRRSSPSEAGRLG